jgi:hypothetical protein
MSSTCAHHPDKGYATSTSDKETNRFKHFTCRVRVVLRFSHSHRILIHHVFGSLPCRGVVDILESAQDRFVSSQAVSRDSRLHPLPEPCTLACQTFMRRGLHRTNHICSTHTPQMFMLHLPAVLRPPCTPTGLLRHFKEFRVARSGPLLQVQHMYSDPVDPRRSGTTMAPETYSSSQVPMLCEFASPSLPVPSPCYKEPRKSPLPLLPSHKSLAIKHSCLHFILQARPTSLFYEFDIRRSIIPYFVPVAFANRYNP